ncbi:hypothetical protein CI102_5333 [Trichoderma harzianum]|nr:hypothetical protein CI102_5333 [Trichoderma harzianum]
MCTYIYYLYEADFDTATSEIGRTRGVVYFSSYSFLLVQTGIIIILSLFRVRIEGLVSVRRGRCGPRHGGA